MTARQQYIGIAAAIGAVGATGAAVIGSTSFLTVDEATNEKICIKTDVAFVENMNKGCYTKTDLSALMGRNVLDRRGQSVAISFSHPTDDVQGLAVARDCATYADLVDKKYYPISSREMRREDYFKRACGTLRLILSARKPETSFFSNGALARADMDSLAKGPPFKIAESVDDQEVPGVFEQSEQGWWRMEVESQNVTVQEIAHADFTRDGVGDMLVFVSITVTDGTAQAGRLGLLEKRTASSAIDFTDIE